jgi:HSF-type DNA-binding
MMKPQADTVTATFPFRLYEMLDSADLQCFDHIVCWLPEGNGFVVRDKDAFVKKVISKFFHHTKWKSFLRQLNLYSFHRISKRGHNSSISYGHGHLRRGQKDLCHQIVRMSQQSLSKSPPSSIGEGSGSSKAIAELISGKDDEWHPQLRQELRKSPDSGVLPYGFPSPYHHGNGGASLLDRPAMVCLPPFMSTLNDNMRTFLQHQQAPLSPNPILDDNLTRGGATRSNSSAAIMFSDSLISEDFVHDIVSIFL